MFSHEIWDLVSEAFLLLVRGHPHHPLPRCLLRCLRFRVWSFSFGVWGMGYGVWGMGYGLWGLGHGLWGLGFGVWGLVFEVWGLGFGVWIKVYGVLVIGFGVCGLGFGVWGLRLGGLGFGVSVGTFARERQWNGRVAPSRRTRLRKVQNHANSYRCWLG